METVFADNFNQTVSIHDEKAVHLIFDERAKGTLFLTFEKDCASLHLNIDIFNSANVKIFLLNHSQQDFHLNVDVQVKQDAHCQMGLLDMEEAPLHWHHFVDLQETGAGYEILSGQLCMPKQAKICDMEVKHTAAYTNGEIKNFAVLMNQGIYEMVANGNIIKGCKQAHSHQTTRVLTLGKDHKTKCIPLLLIDENEVKASHGLTIGQPDEDQMYYLQSRGLTQKQAIGLLSVGYFLPVIGMIDDETIHNELQEDMESKVGLYGRQ